MVEQDKNLESPIAGIPASPLHELPQGVRSVWQVVARMPFENLTKILKLEAHAEKDTQDVLRMPDEVLRDHRRYGTGATCFALTYLLRDLIRRAGHDATLHTCDRRYGPDTHAAVRFDWHGRRWIFDAGYHVVQPLPDDEHDTAWYTPPNPNASRVRRAGERRYECFTGHRGQWQIRFVFKDIPLADAAFKQRWQESFRAEMMTYPVLTKFGNGQMTYLQKTNLITRDAAQGRRQELQTEDLEEIIRLHFRIAPDIIRRALTVARRR